ncbi:MAG: hypothetical protein HZB41_05120 [Ignavibacteriae bacterium]|nr:hypothetical protein [Ignavibacteriota bacterium]
MDKDIIVFYRTLIQYFDLQYFHQLFSKKNYDNENKFLLIRQFIIPIHNLNKTLDELSPYLRNNNNLIIAKRKIKSQLVFYNHLRNRISGHLDDSIIEKAVRENPYIFDKLITKDNIFNSQFSINIYFLEEGINSFIDEHPKQDILDRKYDLMIYDHIILNMLYDFIIECLTFLKETINLLLEIIPRTYFDDEIYKKMKKWLPDSL